jgi:hypothetical protein
MQLTIDNKTMLLNLEKDEFSNDFYSWFQVVEANDFISPVILKRTKVVQWLTISLFWLPIIIGTYFRSIVYKFLFRQYKNKELTEVNKLHFAVCLTDHLAIASTTLAATLIVLNGESLDQVAGGHWFCILQMIYSRFALCYSFIGSLGVSIYRVLLIKHNNFLTDVIGKNVMANLILYGGILLSIVFTTVVKSHDYNKLFNDKCMFIPNSHTLQILDNYEQSRGNLSIMEYYIKVHIGTGLIMAFMIISEIIIYVIFFHHMYKHDNHERLRRLLEPQIISDRNRKNAVSFFGQFCSFVLQFTMLLLLAASYTVGNPNNDLPLVLTVFRRISFAVMSGVEVLTSEVLRKRIFKIDMYNVIFGIK